MADPVISVAISLDPLPLAPRPLDLSDGFHQCSRILFLFPIAQSRTHINQLFTMLPLDRVGIGSFA